mgnify:CR=1 FL=1|jgi:flagellar hook protein FlgE|nr:flagellar hook protein FlgE [Acidimicrobiia bacterium]
MMRSMFSGVSGLRSHQTMMDVVGNNVANVNTPGYKASQVTFQETLTQTVRGAAPGSGVVGGTNPIQIGLGTQVATVDGIFTQGAVQTTGRNTDLMIQGDGYFIVQRGEERFYTRAGSFGFDREGNLVNGNGLKVMGWTSVDANGRVVTTGALEEISIPLGQVIEPESTTLVTVRGNLSAGATSPVTTSVNVYDDLGNATEVAIRFQNNGGNQWAVERQEDDGTWTPVGTVSFGADGSFASTAPDPLQLSPTVSLDLSGLVQYGGTSNLEATSDGHAMGVLQDVTIGADGTVTAHFSNGLTRDMAVIAIATFANPGGLSRVGESTFAASPNSGAAVIGQPGSGDRGSLTPGALEMSNVDLAREFTNLIIAQRGFQANSRVITASDEMLADLVNIRR